MKNGLMLLLFVIVCSTPLMSQEKSNPTIPLIGSEAPSFTAETTNGTLDFPKDYGNNWKIIFSHPRDFTPVCSTELLTPANWQAGDDLMVPQFPYTEKQLQENPSIKDAYYNVGSFIWFKKSNLPVTENK
jgi:hypothetical protein